MGFMMAMGTCCNCGVTFSFNPERVPSIRGRWEIGGFVPDHTGQREPVCEPCMCSWQRKARQRGQGAFPDSRWRLRSGGVRLTVAYR